MTDGIKCTILQLAIAAKKIRQRFHAHEPPTFGCGIKRCALRCEHDAHVVPVTPQTGLVVGTLLILGLGLAHCCLP